MSVSIPFTQYILPHGRREAVTIQVPDAIGTKANKIIAAGYRFECEVLTTGHASFTIHDPTEEYDVAIKICANGPNVSDTVAALINEFDLVPA